MRKGSPAFLVFLSVFFILNCFGQTTERMFAVSVNGKIGFVDKAGAMVIEPKYEIARDLSDGLAAMLLNGKWGYIDETGKEIISPRYEREPGRFSDGLAPVAIERRRAFIDKSGMIKTLLYEDVRPFSEGLAPVKIDSYWGFIDTKGTIVVKPEYTEVTEFSEKRSFVRKGAGFWSMIDQTGQTIARESFGSVLPFSEGLAAACNYRKCGYIDKNGNFAIKAIYGDALRFSGGLAAVWANCRYGYIDKTGKMVIEPQFTYAGEFSEGFAVVAQKDSNYVSKDPNGQRVCIRPSFIGSVGYIDTTGKMVVSPRFGFAHPFSGGLARVTYTTPVDDLAIQGEWGYIDSTGNFAWQPAAWKAEP